VREAGDDAPASARDVVAARRGQLQAVSQAGFRFETPASLPLAEAPTAVELALLARLRTAGAGRSEKGTAHG
jgi:hypothetical protein